MFESFIFFLLISFLLALLSSIAVSHKRDKSVLYSRSVISMLISCTIAFVCMYNKEFLYAGMGIYNGMFKVTALNLPFHMFMLIVAGLILQTSSFYPRKVWTKHFSNVYALLFCKLIYFNSFVTNKMSEQFRIQEYSLLVMFVIIGGIFLTSSADIISVFLAIELQSYGLYLICSIYRDSEKSTTAGLTYFLLGGLSSCFILLGSAILYANSGNSTFDGLYVINNISASMEHTFISLNNMHYVNVSLVVLSVGFLFKVTAAPFHFWSPEVYDAVPTIVTTFIAIFAKISIFVFLLELVVNTGGTFNSDYMVQLESKSYSVSWTFTLLVSSMLSLVVGSVLGLTQFRIKKLYAYSTISHVGFLLLALVINSLDSIQSFIFYLTQYTLTNLNAFIILLAMGYSMYVYTEKTNSNEYGLNTGAMSDKKNSPIQLISQIKGFFYINPTLSLSLAVTIFSFVGIPPLIGFFAKQTILSSALDNGYVFMAFVAILTSVISASYYLTIIKQMFFNQSNYVLNPQLKNVTLKANVTDRSGNILKNLIINENNIILSGYLAVSASILTLTILLFILSPQEWLSIANILATIVYVV